ncbi:unnamed protein product, partial [Brassica napus]
AEKPVVLTDEPLREASPENDVNPEVDVLATPTVTEVVADGEKSNVEKWGQELQNRENILPWIRFTSNNTLQN